MKRWALVVVGIAILCAPVLGHHSFALMYIEADTIEVEGDIVEFQYRNPHSWVFVLGQENRDAFARPKTFGAEWTGTSGLERIGVTKNTLKPGDNVRIWASPNRDPNDNRIRLKRIERRADGWKWGQERRQNR